MQRHKNKNYEVQWLAVPPSKGGDKPHTIKYYITSITDIERLFDTTKCAFLFQYAYDLDHSTCVSVLTFNNL